MNEDNREWKEKKKKIKKKRKKEERIWQKKERVAVFVVMRWSLCC